MIQANILYKEIQKLLTITPNTVIPSLECVKIYTLRNHTNLMFSSLEVTLNIITDFNLAIECFVPLKTFAQLLKNFDNKELTFKVTKTHLEVNSESAKHKIALEVGTGYPNAVKLKGEPLIEIKYNDLHKVNRILGFCEKKTENFANVLLHCTSENVKFVTTNGHMLGIARINEKPSKKLEVVIPKPAFHVLDLLGEDLNIYENGFGNQKYTFTFKAGSIPFPKYEKVIPADFAFNISVDMKTLLSEIKIAKLYANKTTETLTFECKEQLEISSADEEWSMSAETQLLADITGIPCNFKLNASKFIGALNCLKEEILLVIKGNKENKPFVIENSDFYILIMPTL